jgi:hypothetical protein
MAHVTKSILGPISGKIGNKVYYVRNGKQCVRSVPKKKSQGNSEAQLEQQIKMAKATLFAFS